MADNSIVNSPKTTTLNPGHEPKKVGNNFPYLQAKRRQIMNRQAISLHHNTDDRMMIILIAGTGVKDNGSLVLLILLMAFFAREIKARWKIHYAKWAHGRNFANYLIMAYYWLSVVSNSNSNHKKPLFVVWDFSMAIFEKSQVFTGSGTTIYFNPYLGTLPYHLMCTV